MSTKDYLFELIKSLTKSEKRYFKVHVARHSTNEMNNYSILFEHIDKIETYNEADILKHFRKESFIKNFSIAKKRLYDQIITALNAFHSNNSIDAQLYKLMQGSTVLYNKALYQQAYKLLNSAYKLAVKHERFSIQLEIEQKLQQVIEAKHYSSIKKEEIRELEDRTTSSFFQLELQSKLWFAKSNLFLDIQKKGGADEPTSEQLHKHHNHINTLISQQELSVSNTYLYHHTEAAYFFSIGDYTSSLYHLKKNIALLEFNLFLLESFPNYYFGTLSNAVYITEKLNLAEEADELLLKIKRFPNKLQLNLSEDLLLKMFLSTSSTEISMFTNRGEFIKALGIIPSIESELVAYDTKIPVLKQLFFYYKFAGIHMGVSDYNGALKWINKILNTSNIDNNEDIIAYTHLFNLIVHLELKNDHLLPYTIKNTHRFLKTRNRLNTVEKKILQFISKFNKTISAIEEQEIWEDFHKELQPLKESTEYQKIQDYFDFEVWVASKAHKKRFDDLIKQKYLQPVAP
jgi:hypothetical protein